MAELREDQVSLLHPSILRLDEANAMVKFTYDQNIGATPAELLVFGDDPLRYYCEAVKIVKKERKLSRFVEQCGILVSHTEQPINNILYAKAADFAGVSVTDRNATAQLDEVITHFGTHAEVFKRLYSTSYLPRLETKKTDRKVGINNKRRVEIVENSATIVAAINETEPQEKTKTAPQPNHQKTDIKSSIVRYQVVRRTFIGDLIEEPYAPESAAVLSPVTLNDFKNKTDTYLLDVVENQGGVASKNSLVRALGERGFAQEDAQSLVHNALRRQVLYRGHRRSGMLTFTSSSELQPKLKPATDVKSEQNATDEFTFEDIKAAEKVLSGILSTNYFEKGISIRSLVRITESDENEVRSLVNKLTAVGILLRREKNAGGFKKARKIMVVSFANQSDWETYRDTPKDLLHVLTNKGRTD
jgi:hypothetical protein